MPTPEDLKLLDELAAKYTLSTVTRGRPRQNAAPATKPGTKGRPTYAYISDNPDLFTPERVLAARNSLRAAEERAADTNARIEASKERAELAAEKEYIKKLRKLAPEARQQLQAKIAQKLESVGRVLDAATVSKLNRIQSLLAEPNMAVSDAHNKRAAQKLERDEVQNARARQKLERIQAGLQAAARKEAKAARRVEAEAARAERAARVARRKAMLAAEKERRRVAREETKAARDAYRAANPPKPKPPKGSVGTMPADSAPLEYTDDRRLIYYVKINGSEAACINAYLESGRLSIRDEILADYPESHNPNWCPPPDFAEKMPLYKGRMVYDSPGKIAPRIGYSLSYIVNTLHKRTAILAAEGPETVIAAGGVYKYIADMLPTGPKHRNFDQAVRGAKHGALYHGKARRRVKRKSFYDDPSLTPMEAGVLTRQAAAARKRDRIMRRQIADAVSRET